MSVKMRQLVEKEIATAVVKALIDGGFTLHVFDGEEDHPIRTTVEETLADLFLTDEDYLNVHNPALIDGGKIIGWVRFVYGNDGWDVVCDYTINLEQYIGEGTPVEKLIDKYSD